MTEEINETEECFITFFLGDEEYAISIDNAREIIGLKKISNLPDTPDYVKGVINLRDNVIPLVDLRLRFKLPFKEYNHETCIVICEISFNGMIMVMGLIVDSVTDVTYIPIEKIDKSSIKHSLIKNHYIDGIVKNSNGGVKVILNVNRIINNLDLETIADKTPSD